MYPSSSSTKLESFEKQSTVESQDVDVSDSANDPIAQFPAKGDDFKPIESCVDTNMTDSSQNRVEPFRFRSNPTSMDRSLLSLVVKSIRFQVSLMISLITFPKWLVSTCLAFVSEPYRTMRRFRRYLLSKIVEFYDVFESEDHKQMLQVVSKLSLGFFWAVYVGLVLFALLASAFMVSSFTITRLARKPLVIEESLSLDYTKNSPEAYVPIITEKIRGTSNQRTEITVSMTLPESEYNRNLGMFQVRVDLLSANGEVLVSLKRPCMVRYRSELIRLLQTLLKIAPLVTGYASEIQTLNLKLKEFRQEDVLHAACLKVVIEQRAEFRPGAAGIPEIYDASLFLESKLPFFERIIWNWRRTLFVWIGLGLFFTELLFVLVFCRSLIIPITPSIDNNG